MKKIIALLLALIMVFSMVACGNTNTPADPSTPVSQNPAESNKPVESDKPVENDPVEPSQPVEELNNEVVEYYMGKANEVKVTDTHVIFTDDGSGEDEHREEPREGCRSVWQRLTCGEAGGTSSWRWRQERFHYL